MSPPPSRGYWPRWQGPAVNNGREYGFSKRMSP
uniref:Uncharacterized protein n=1 Tax=Siphoviridae sp. ctXZQ9 TaxID=2825545 RepID=A0A8S5P3H8_9CAUD|nr:MAG TPA: hypothetical protein [Siphoviridae sp. ctXZQ9]